MQFKTQRTHEDINFPRSHHKYLIAKISIALYLHCIDPH